MTVCNSFYYFSQILGKHARHLSQDLYHCTPSLYLRTTAFNYAIHNMLYTHNKHTRREKELRPLHEHPTLHKKKMFTVGTRQVKSKQGQKKERGRMEKTGGTNNSGSVRKTTLSSTRWFCTFVHNVNISRSTEQRTTRCVTKKLTLTPPLQPSWLPRQRGGVATSGAVVIPSQSERAAAHSKQKCPCTVLTTVGPLRQHQEQAWSKLTSYERAFQHC